MYRNILIATDGSKLSTNAATKGLQLAHALGAKVTVLLVAPPYHAFQLGGVDVFSSDDSYEERCREAASGVLDPLKREAAEHGVSCATRHVFEDNPWKAIVDVASSQGCDLIHMGSHGAGGVASLVLGSQTQKVLTHTKIPVLICR